MGYTLDTSGSGISFGNTEALENTIASTGGKIVSSGVEGASAMSGAANTASTAAITLANANVIDLKNKYASSSGGRLVNFDYAEGYDDDQRRAYFQLKGDTSALKKDIASDSGVSVLLSALESTYGFTNFVLMGITENHQEKQAVMQTINDYFVATFSGREPQIVNITGALPFDASSSSTSWYINYINAYSYLFRASVLAKYKLQLKLIIPNFSTYICYPINFTSGLQSSQDNIIQFQMSSLVVKEEVEKAKGISFSALTKTTTAEEVIQDEEDAKKQEETKEKNNPQDVGKKSSKKNFIETCTDFCNTVITGVGTNDLAKGINTINKTIAGISQLAGAVDTVTGNKYGIRKIIKI